MEDFYLELQGGQLKITKENEQLRFEAGALHQEEQKITTITLFLDENDIKQIGEWLKNVGLQKENGTSN